MEKQIMDVREFMAVSGLSRSLTYRLIKEGTIPTIRLGRKVLIPKAVALQLLSIDTRQKN